MGIIDVLARRKTVERVRVFTIIGEQLETPLELTFEGLLERFGRDHLELRHAKVLERETDRMRGEVLIPRERVIAVQRISRERA